MLFKYEYVKIVPRDGISRFAYQRTFLWIFKRYLSCAPSSFARHSWSTYGRFVRKLNSSCMSDRLPELKEWVKLSQSPEYTVEPAETKLEQNLNGTDI